MKALTLKKTLTVLRHVFIEGNANNVELAQVAIPVIVIITAVFFIFGHFPKH